MSTEPITNVADGNREKAGDASDEALVKRLQFAIKVQEAYQKALDELCKRMAGGKLSDDMVLRFLEWDLASQSGRQSRRARTRRVR
jgi:hypothetical protein